MDESNKRQRTTSSSNNELHIKDLPDGLLVGISSYLAKPSVALFAIAMSPNNSQPTQSSKAIISAIDWNALDFNDIEKDLAAKLSDVDIDKILWSINAVNNIKILKLAGCVNITGIGLNMLRSASAAIEQIDLTLVAKYEVPHIEPKPKMSEDLVLPILYSIINRGSSLKQLEFPKKWRDTASTQMTQFLERYNDYLTNQRYCCSKCDRVLVEEEDNGEWICRGSNIWYGTQNFTCSGCLNHFCSDNACVDENGDDYSSWCKKCEKEYCKSCVSSYRCGECQETFCQKCSVTKECEEEGCFDVLCYACYEEEACHFCNRMRCGSCINSYRCNLDGCNKVICAGCVDSNGEGGICNACNKVFCSAECQYLECSKDAAKACSTCSVAAASDFRSKLQESKKENEELCQGMDDLYKKYMNVEEEK